MARPCYLFDLDGTLCDITHRLHFIQKNTADAKPDWDSFFAACADDKPIASIVQLAHDLRRAGEAVVYVSGRSDAVRDKTEYWLMMNGLSLALGMPGALYMRKAGDHRPDHVVKSELLDQIIADGWAPVMAFEDRNQVVKMWRARGIPCAQVAEGDF